MSTNEHYLIKDFKRLSDRRELGSGYLLFGESTAFIRGICLGLLNYLEGKDFSAPGNRVLSDGMIVKKDESGSIGIESSRAIISFLWQKPFASPKRAVFIDGAEYLTLQAENALLKIVEEPPPHGLLIMSVKDPSVIIPPLASRLQRVYVSSAGLVDEPSKEIHSLAKKFFVGQGGARKDIIAELLEKEMDLKEFVAALMIECRKDPIKNFELLRRLTDRWSKISEWNTNKKLQLETLL